MNYKTKYFIFIRFYSVNLLMISVFLCMSIVFCKQTYARAASSRQEFYNKIQEDRENFKLFLKELESFKKQDNLDGISDKKIDIFLVMENILKQKRQLFQAKVNELQLKYEKEMNNGSDMEKMDTVHNQMKAYELIIEKISNFIKKYNLRRKLIFEEKIKRHTKVISRIENEKKKKDIVTLLLPLVAKRDNLIKSGASPSEIYAVKKEIKLLKEDYIVLGEEIGISENESLNELAEILSVVDESFDKESERRKNIPDGYKYRKQERVIDRGIEYKRLNEKSSSVRRIYDEEGMKKDQRLDAIRIEHDKAAKTILGK